MKHYIILLIFLSIGLTCFAQEQTRLTQYPLMYEEKPVTIFFASATNSSTLSLPENLILNAGIFPISQNGYYTISPYLADKILDKFPNLQDSLTADNTYSAYNRIFGADAIFKMNVTGFNKVVKDPSFLEGFDPLCQGNITLNCELISTKTSRTLWTFSGTISFKEVAKKNYNAPMPGVGIGGGVHFSKSYTYPEYLLMDKKGFSLLKEKVELPDDIILYRVVSKLKDNLPYGKHHLSYLKDKNDEIVPLHSVEEEFDVKI